MIGIADFLDKIPIRQDFNSTVILLGVVQGLVLSVLLLTKPRSYSLFSKLLGFFLLSISLVIFDIYLCYTGLMKYTLHFNDSTEVFTLLFGPIIYFIIYALLNKQDQLPKYSWLHLLLPLLYFANQIFFLIQPIEVKLNAYINAYHSHIGFIQAKTSITDDPLHLKNEIRLLLFLSFSFYICLSVWTFIKFERTRGVNWRELKSGNKFHFSRNIILSFIAIFIVLFIVYVRFESDHGDHYIALFAAIFIYSISIFLLKQSQFFQKSWIADKYDTSGFKGIQENELLQNIKRLTEQEKYYLSPKMTLSTFADELKVPPNYLSQVINQQFKQNFNDFINHQRIAEAKKRMIGSEYQHLSIAGIGLSVGFRSKSAFYTAFKKHTHLTPTAYLNQNNN